ncbi:hypothetical protein UFOVP19_30 [uncultured Caudovirales phage]|uniref:Uncharacterized protein n=1 Tax=uncultured Caudovirales phage TaxID=2100421 RepID=A0A6J5KPA0_9CAUD|nr:hypothetical protein UFOVP19_30 [uncultured Caudovirales phage]
MSEEKKKYGAWKKTTPKGEVINFTIEGKKYNMWVNTYKKESKHPDYQIYEDNYVMTSKQELDKGDLPF